MSVCRLLEAKKKKLEKAQTEEDMDFRGHEQIKFGDVVEAPPKLTSVPKVFNFKTYHEMELFKLCSVLLTKQSYVCYEGIQGNKCPGCFK